ncbi:MAG: exo-beta-N-acetylmuramidase NamZ family protein [Janthinobacterium lividum]
MRDKFALLRGSKVGLVTNHTGLTQAGQPTIDVLYEASNVRLTALFGPEHGLRGEFDQPTIADGLDPKTGLPVYSLYGARTQPSEEQLANLDTLVFDIQDIGCRFYTYLSTLGNILEAANAHNKRVVLLDRPNPITGTRVEGPLADPDKLAFVAYHPIPIRHGLTFGELAKLIHAEKLLSCPLEIVPCQGWQRGNWYDATGLLWTNPSPNMRRLTAAALYPGVGLLEMINVSVGRGTDTPFEIFGAPYLDAREFASALNATHLPGVRFVPVEFTPNASVFADETCRGVQILLTDRDALDAVRVGITLALVLRRLAAEHWQPEKLMTLLVNQKAYDSVIAGLSYAKIASGWAEDLKSFSQRVSGYRLYD